MISSPVLLDDQDILQYLGYYKIYPFPKYGLWRSYRTWLKDNAATNRDYKISKFSSGEPYITFFNNDLETQYRFVFCDDFPNSQSFTRL